MAVVERLNAETVAHQYQAGAARVPDREGENALQTLQTVQSPSLVAVQQHLRIRTATKHTTNGFELAAQLREVVYLTVVGDRRPAAAEGHGLGPRRREVEDAQSPMAQTYALVDEHAVGIGPAVREGLRHGAHGPIEIFPGARAVEPADTAHASVAFRVASVAICAGNGMNAAAACE